MLRQCNAPSLESHHIIPNHSRNRWSAYLRVADDFAYTRFEIGWVTGDEDDSILDHPSQLRIAHALALLRYDFWFHLMYDDMDSEICTLVLANGQAGEDSYDPSDEERPRIRVKARMSELLWCMDPGNN